MSPKKAETAVGLDISSNSLKVAAVNIQKGEPILNTLGIVRIPEGVVRDGEVEDGVTLVESLKELWHITGLKERSVILGIANQKVIVRPIELPYMEKEELDSALRFQVQEFIPIPIEDAILDFDIIEEFMTAEEERMLTVLLVAAHKDMIQGFVEVLKAAGLTPAAIDLKATDKTEAIRELAAALCKTTGLRRQKQIVEDVLKREESASTFIGQGIAIPHART